MWSDGHCGTGSPDERIVVSEIEIDESSGDVRRRDPRRGGRLLAWGILVGLLALASYGARLSDAETPERRPLPVVDIRGGLIQYGIMLVLILAIARGFGSPLLALERPASIGRAVKLGAVAFGSDPRHSAVFWDRSSTPETSRGSCRTRGTAVARFPSSPTPSSSCSWRRSSRSCCIAAWA